MTEEHDRIEAALAAAAQTAAEAAARLRFPRDTTIEDVVRQLQMVQQALLDEADRVRDLTDLLNRLGAAQGEIS